MFLGINVVVVGSGVKPASNKPTMAVMAIANSGDMAKNRLTGQKTGVTTALTCQQKWGNDATAAWDMLLLLYEIVFVIFDMIFS